MHASPVSKKEAEFVHKNIVSLCGVNFGPLLNCIFLDDRTINVSRGVKQCRLLLASEREQISVPLPPSGLEPEIQKLISKHKQELKKLRTLHEAELLQADDRAAQSYARQCEELRQQLEREKDEQCESERELAKQR